MSLATAGAAVWLLQTAPPEAVQAPDAGPPRGIEPLRMALRENAVNPYRWVELAEGYEQAGNRDMARFCFQRAEDFGAHLPPIWIRAAGFHFRLGEREAGLRAGVRAQSISDASDAFLFSYYDRFVRETPIVIRALSGERRTLPAYFQYLLGKGRIDDAGLGWQELKRRGWITRNLGISYVERLLKQRRYQTAQQVWLHDTGHESGYSGVNLIYNGGFEFDPSGYPLDWKMVRHETVEAVRDGSVTREGKFSLRVSFPGTENVSFQNVSQTVVVTPGRYRFSVWVKTGGVTTDQGIRFAIQDAESPQRLSQETDPVQGTQNWTELSSEFHVSGQTNLINVSIVRRPSGKFDNKVAGTVWIDGVSLTRR